MIVHERKQKKSIIIIMAVIVFITGLAEAITAFVAYPCIANYLLEFSGFNHKQQEIYNKLASHLKISEVFDEHGKIILKRIGREGDGGYVVPIKAFEKSDVLMGFGIADDITFEEYFIKLYSKDAYGFDCGIDEYDIAIKNKLFHFSPKCISSDLYLYGSQNSNKKIATFTELLREHNLFNKKIFIKMDIEGAEYKAFEDIMHYTNDITGIVIEIHFGCGFPNEMEANNLLSKLAEEFILVHLHANNCMPKTFNFKSKIFNKPIPRILELSYINKNLVTKSTVLQNQRHPINIDMPNCPKKPDVDFELIY